VLRSSQRRVGLVAGLALGVTIAAAPAAAQEDAEDAVVVGPSAHVAAGTCEAPTAGPLHELAPFETGFLERDDSDSERVGSGAAAAMLSSSTELEVEFDAFVDEPHALVVVDAARRPVACGEVGGYLADDSLVVGVRTLEGTGLAGFATLWDDRDVVAVELHLAEELLAPRGAVAEQDGEGEEDRAASAGAAATNDAEAPSQDGHAGTATGAVEDTGANNVVVETGDADAEEDTGTASGAQGTGGAEEIEDTAAPAAPAGAEDAGDGDDAEDDGDGDG